MWSSICSLITTFMSLKNFLLLFTSINILVSWCVLNWEGIFEHLFISPYSNKNDRFSIQFWIKYMIFLQVKSKLGIISSYTDATDGLITHGWITKIEVHGCFVRFYNGVHGYAPRQVSNLSLYFYHNHSQLYFDCCLNRVTFCFLNSMFIISSSSLWLISSFPCHWYDMRFYVWGDFLSYGIQLYIEVLLCPKCVLSN